MVSVPSAVVMLNPVASELDSVIVALLYNTGIGVILCPRQMVCVSFLTVNFTVSFTVMLMVFTLLVPHALVSAAVTW